MQNTGVENKWKTQYCVIFYTRAAHVDSEKVALDLELGSQTKVHYKGNYQDMWGIGENVLLLYVFYLGQIWK